MRRLLTVALILAMALYLFPAIAAGRPMFAGRPLAAEMNGASEVPVNDSPGTGSARVWLNQGQGEVCFSVEWTDLSGPVLAAHIHPGVAGVNNPPVVGFHGNPFGPTFGETDGPLQGCVEVETDLIKDIRQNPDAYYVNLHTAEFGGGEIRGQLSK